MQNKVIIIVLVVAVVLVGAIVVSRNSSSPASNVASSSNSAMEQEKMMADKMEKDKMMADNSNTNSNSESMAKDGDKMADDKMAMEKSAGTYVDYSESVLNQAKEATKSGRKAVIFFHASWCPNCIAADKAFKSSLSSGSFPENVTVIKTDYDSQTELKKKYGITGQHTFVQIDSSGNQITKWIGGDTAELKTKVQ